MKKYLKVPADFLPSENVALEIVCSTAFLVQKMSIQFKEEREKCWGARDNYWKCLDSNEDKNEKCLKFRKEFENSCSNQWVKHFDRKRKYEKFKQDLDKVGWKFPLKEEKE